MWRKLKMSDLQPMIDDSEHGIAARDPHIDDTPFNGLVIIGHEMVGTELYLRLARPMAYASALNSRIPMLYAEQYSLSAASATEPSMWALEVWESRDGHLLTLRT